MKRKTIAMVLFASMLVLFASAASAQDGSKAPERNLLIVSTVSVKPHKMQAFEEMMQTTIVPAFKKGGATEYAVWKTSFGNVMQYHLVTPLPGFKALDGPSPVVKGLGDEAASVFGKLGEMVDAVESKIYTERPDLSHFGKMEGAPGIAVLVGVKINAGKERGFEEFIRSQYLPILKKTDVPGVWTSKLAFGGDPGEYVMVQVETNFAALEKGPPVSRVMTPEEAAKMFDKLPPGTVKEVSVSLARYVPELSYTAAAQ